MNNPEPLFCCELECNTVPEWQLQYDDDVYNFVEACTAHVGALLGTGTTHVWSLTAEEVANKPKE